MFTNLSMGRSQGRQAGLSLIELIIFIVIVSIAIVGVLSVLNVTARSSADPLLRKQALAIAESMLEEVELAHFSYCDPSDANAASAANTGGCATTVENVGPEAGNTRPYDNVNDYVTAFGTAKSYSTTLSGTSSIVIPGYAVTVTITPEALNGIASTAAPASMEVLRITVTVSYGSDSVTLEGYRTRYAPNLV